MVGLKPTHLTICADPNCGEREGGGLLWREGRWRIIVESGKVENYCGGEGKVEDYCGGEERWRIM